MENIINTCSHHDAKRKKILFICKKRHYMKTDDGIKGKLTSSGLLNSAGFVVDMLNRNGIDSKLVDVVDNNCIDREVTQYKPTHVIIEALWVVPEKFKILTKLHPKVKWIIRLHSNIPFLSNEGIAFKWLSEYIKYKNVYLGSNTRQTVDALEEMLNTKVFYLPNYYTIKERKHKDSNSRFLDIGCFGAIRPLKNQLIQAVAAIEYANENDKILRFHMNGDRIEGRGEPVLENIKALFAANPKHELILHPWLNHKEFLDLVSKMDLGMQVSFSETFNIVAADFVNCNVPVVVSPEIEWVSAIFKCPPTEKKKIKRTIGIALWTSKLGLQHLNLIKLKNYCDESECVWVHLFKK